MRKPRTIPTTAPSRPGSAGRRSGDSSGYCRAAACSMNLKDRSFSPRYAAVKPADIPDTSSNPHFQTPWKPRPVYRVPGQLLRALIVPQRPRRFASQVNIAQVLVGRGSRQRCRVIKLGSVHSTEAAYRWPGTSPGCRHPKIESGPTDLHRMSSALKHFHSAWP